VPTITSNLSAGATRAMWRATWDGEQIGASQPLRRFLPVLCRFLSGPGRFQWTGISVVNEQFGRSMGRRYTSRWIEKLMAQAVRLGLIRRVRHSAPGRPAVYEAVIPDHPGYRPLAIRRRGIRPRRLLARWRGQEALCDPLPFEIREPPAPAPRGGSDPWCGRQARPAPG
jgi:hypothetical protein